MFAGRHLLAAAGMAAAFFAAAPAASAQAKVTVFAAASLAGALDAVSAAWQAEAGGEATISYAASSALAKQIEEGRPGRRLRLGRSRLDGLSRRARPDPAGDRGRAARQPPGAGGAGGFGRGRGSRRASISPDCSATAALPSPMSTRCRRAATARRRSRRLGSGRASRRGWRRPRTCARRWRWSRSAGAARHRLCDRRRRRARRAHRRHLPRGHASADRLSSGGDGGGRPRRRPRSSPSCGRRRRARLRGPGLHRAGAGDGLKPRARPGRWSGCA